MSRDESKIMDLPHDITADRINISSPLNSNGMFIEGGGGYESSLFSPSMDNAFQDQMHQDSLVRSDESDPNEDDDDPKYSSRRRSGKGPQSKNLQAERNRRKKLNDRLYALRALVPNISKLDRASILGDAIEYVKELQKQAEDLKHELEQHYSDDEDNARKAEHDGNNDSKCTSIVHQNGTKHGPKREHDNLGNGYHSSKQSQGNDKVQQQMEPQVQVYQVEGNEFFVKVFCEHRFGGFVRLMEALNALGFEVANVNTTRHTCLASSIFKVERKNDESVEADDVKESLLELTRNPRGMWHNGNNSNNGGAESEDMDNDYSMNNHSHHHHHH